MDPVVRGVRSFGDSLTDDISQLFETATVVRHDAESAPKLAYLFDFRMLKEFTKCHVVERSDLARRAMINATASTANMIAARPQLPMSCSIVANLDCAFSIRDASGPSVERSLMATNQYQLR